MTISNRAKRRGYRPLQITAHLQSPVVGDPLLPIDAVLYYAAHREALGARWVSLPGELQPSEGERVSLPLLVVDGHGPQWYYAASSAVWSEPYADGVDHWTCRFDSQLLDLIQLPKGRLNTASGRYRGYRMPVYYRAALSVRWYVVGEPETITRLLTCGVTHLGKKTSQGWGAVLRWEIEPCEHDWSVTGPDGRLMRPVPDPAGTMLVGYRPPYWLRSRQTICRMPDRG